MTRIRNDPRISLNQLGEYMTANASARRRIIHRQKYPPTYMTIYYEDAFEPIVRYYTDAGYTTVALSDEIARLEAAQATSDAEETKNRSCAEALAAFLDSTDDIDLSAYDIRRGVEDPPKLLIDGVSVSVRPDLILTQGDDIVGAVKFYFKKEPPLEKAAAEYTSTVLHQYLEDVMGVSSATPRNVIVVDVFAGRLYRAPKSFRRRRADVSAACEEIRLRWAGV